MCKLSVYLKWGSAPFSVTGKVLAFALCPCRVLDQKEDGCVVDMHHFNSGAQSVLAYATVNGSLVGWDLRSSSNAWTLKHDLKSGLITSFAVDIHQCWLCIGKPTAALGCHQHLQVASCDSWPFLISLLGIFHLLCIHNYCVIIRSTACFLLGGCVRLGV